MKRWLTGGGSYDGCLLKYILFYCGGSSVCAVGFVGQWWISPEFFFYGCVLIFLAKLAWVAMGFIFVVVG